MNMNTKSQRNLGLKIGPMMDRLTRNLIAFTALIVGSVAGSAQAQHTLTINNNDVVSGRIVQIEDSKLVWQSPLFRDSISAPLSKLSHVEFDRKTPAASEELPFQIRTVTGDLINADITEIDEEFVHTRSQRHGELKISLDQVASIIDQAKQQTVKEGFNNFDAFRSYENGKDAWACDGSRLSTSKVLANAYVETKNLPNEIEVQLECKFTEMPDFLFGLKVPKTLDDIESIPRIETWEGTLVLGFDGDFEVLVEELPESTDTVSLTIQWNQKTNQILVFDSLGVKLCDKVVSFPEDKSKPGFFFRNLNGDLSVTRFRVGPKVAGRNAKVGELKTSGGDIFPIKELAFDGETWTVGEDKIAKEEFFAAKLAKPAPQTNEQQSVVRYADGAELHGTLVSGTAESLQIKTDFGDANVSCRYDGVARIQLGTEKQPVSNENQQHVLTIGDNVLHGKLAMDENSPGSVFLWSQAGAESPVSISHQSQCRIERLSRPESLANAPAGLVDTLHLENGDLIYCKTISASEKSLNIRTASGEHEIATKDVKAIDLGRREKKRLVSFGVPVGA